MQKRNKGYQSVHPSNIDFVDQASRNNVGETYGGDQRLKASWLWSLDSIWKGEMEKMWTTTRPRERLRWNGGLSSLSLIFRQSSILSADCKRASRPLGWLSAEPPRTSRDDDRSILSKILVVYHRQFYQPTASSGETHLKTLIKIGSDTQIITTG